jgi:UDP-N-acetylglucosamine acyltransferase
MIGGGARISLDVPPFSMATERNTLIGLNVVGLRRRGIKREILLEIKRAWHAVDSSIGNLRDIAAATLREGAFTTDEARSFLEFYQGGRRGFVRTRRGANADESTGE